MTKQQEDEFEKLLQESEELQAIVNEQQLVDDLFLMMHHGGKPHSQITRTAPESISIFIQRKKIRNFMSN